MGCLQKCVVTFIILMDLRLFFESKRNCGSALLMCRILCRFTSGSPVKVPLNCCDDDMRERITQRIILMKKIAAFPQVFRTFFIGSITSTAKKTFCTSSVGHRQGELPSPTSRREERREREAEGREDVDVAEERRKTLSSSIFYV